MESIALKFLVVVLAVNIVQCSRANHHNKREFKAQKALSRFTRSDADTIKGLFTEMSTELAAVKSELQAIKQKDTETKVHFMACGSDFVSFSANGVVKFDHVVSGSGYSTSTGAFTCPVSGVYVFNWSTHPDKATTVKTSLYVGGVMKNRMYAYETPDWTWGANTAVLQCNKDQKVEIKSTYDGKLDSGCYSTFSGYVLYLN